MHYTDCEQQVQTRADALVRVLQTGQAPTAGKQTKKVQNFDSTSGETSERWSWEDTRTGYRRGRFGRSPGRLAQDFRVLLNSCPLRSKQMAILFQTP